MFDDLKKDKNLLRVLIILLIIAVGSYVFNIVSQIIGSFSDIIIMLVMAWLVSFILEPLVEKTQHFLHLSKSITTTLIFILITAITIATIFLFIPAVTLQTQSFIKIAPSYFASSPQFIHKFGDSMTAALNNSVTFLPSIASFIFSIFIVLIISFYFIIDRDGINRELYELTPKKWHSFMRSVQKVIDSVFASFLRVQLLFGIIIGITTWIALRIFNVDFAASTALLSGIFATIPLIGPVFAIIPPLLVAFIADPFKALIIGIIMLIIQQFIFNILGPKLLGNAFKLHPAIILISFIVGAKIAGPIGAVFAIPVVGIITVVLRKHGHNLQNLAQDK